MLAFGNDDSLATTFSTATSITDTGGATNTLYKAETGFFTVYNGPTKGDTLYLRISRDAADAADNLAVDAHLHGIMLEYYSDASTDD